MKRKSRFANTSERERELLAEIASLKQQVASLKSEIKYFEATRNGVGVQSNI